MHFSTWFDSCGRIFQRRQLSLMNAVFTVVIVWPQSENLIGMLLYCYVALADWAADDIGEFCRCVTMPTKYHLRHREICLWSWTRNGWRTTQFLQVARSQQCAGSATNNIMVDEFRKKIPVGRWLFRFATERAQDRLWRHPRLEKCHRYYQLLVILKKIIWIYSNVTNSIDVFLIPHHSSRKTIF